MINTFRKIWVFGNARKKYFISAIAANILRSLLGITQLYAIMTVTDAVFGKGENAVMKLVILTAVCIIGNFAASYFEQTNAMNAGLLMTADKRISLGEMLRRVPHSQRYLGRKDSRFDDNDPAGCRNGRNHVAHLRDFGAFRLSRNVFVYAFL